MSEIYPEQQPGHVPQALTVAGMDLGAALPEGMLPVSALVVVRCLAPEGDADMLWWSATPGLPSWEVDGMCSFVKHGIKADWDEGMCDHEPPEDGDDEEE